MKKRTISKLKSFFTSKKGKRQHEQQSSKCSRSPSPDSRPASPSDGETYHPIQRTPPPSRTGVPPSPPVPTNSVAPVAPEPSGPQPLMPCLVCGRTFVPQSLAKHVKICEKMTVKKRKTFDSSRQRREGTDLEQYLPKNFGLPENSPFLEKSPPPVVKATPKPKVQSVRSVMMKPTSDLQKCPHCNRAFGVRAFERHVEWCADKAKILPAAPAQPPQHIANAKQRLNARTQYKAPPVRGRRASQSREKSSNSRSASVESTRGGSPPPPREYGDYKRSRARASESGSSNDCHEDNSNHVPVIRNSRNTQNNSSGDANVKARQARLARDISNSRKQQQSQAPPIQQTNNPGTSEKDTNKLKTNLNIKKQKQLKKLEEIANKYKESKEKKEDYVKGKSSNKEVMLKSQIPIKNWIDKKSDVKTKIYKKKENSNGTEPHEDVPKRTKIDKKGNVEGKKKNKESTMSIDSLDDSNSNTNKNCQSVGINTELLCPCVPCVIHESNDQGFIKTKKVTTNKKEIKKSGYDHPQKVELLYKNPNMKKICDTESKENFPSDIINVNESTVTVNFASSISDNSSNKNINKNKYDSKDKVLDCDVSCSESDTCLKSPDRIVIDVTQNITENDKEHDLSEENYEDSLKNDDDYNDLNVIDSRHGSGETYTKFTENPEDLEEFFKLTDNMLCEQATNKLDTVNVETDLNTFHTPQTDSLETLNSEILLNDNSSFSQNQFSDALDNLKVDFQDLMQQATREFNNQMTAPKEAKESNPHKNICDMEHITIYEVKQSMCSVKQDDKILKLPSINDSNKTVKSAKNKTNISNIYKTSRKNKMLGQQCRNYGNYQTFIIQNREDSADNSDEAPPLKLPRIDNTRVDDNYDPFASAARQMKELMSCDKNIPKKVANTSKDYNRTLPNLKQAKEKLSQSHPRPENTKMMKDTINKTYQKTPSLQRMKSFGSTNNDNNSSFGGRCSSFRVSRNDKKPTQKLNSTFTKSSKENISTADRAQLNRSNSMNRSFSSYSNSCYSTPKLKDRIPKLSQSMHHGFQRTTTKQPLKLEKVNKNADKSGLVCLDSIFSYEKNALMTDSNYIDPRLINENDNLPINVNTILNNPEIISSMESLLTTENLPAKFESFSTFKNNNNHDNSLTESLSNTDEKNNNIVTSPTVSDLSSRYDKMISSLEQSVTSKTSGRDDDSLCEDFDLEEFMTSFDEEIHKQKSASKRTYSSTTRIVAHSEICNDIRRSDTKVVNSPKVLNSHMNGMNPVNKSTSLIFSHNNIKGDKTLPSPIKRSTSFLDSIQKKTPTKADDSKSRRNVDQLEEDIMQSLKDFDKFYESQKNDNGQLSKEINSNNKSMYSDTIKRNTRKKNDVNTHKSNNVTNGDCTPNGKASNDSAYSSLNRISPSKLSLCNTKESNGITSLERIPAGSDASSGLRDDARSTSSEEFLAMERSTELGGPVRPPDVYKEEPKTSDKHASRNSSRTSPAWRSRNELSSSGSENSLYRTKKEPAPAPRLSRFCHECGSKFPVDTAKFCIECGVKRLTV